MTHYLRVSTAVVGPHYIVYSRSMASQHLYEPRGPAEFELAP